MPTRPHQTGLAAIALFRLVKGVLLLLVGLGLLKLVHADIATLFSRLMEARQLECRLPDHSCAGSERRCVAAAQRSHGGAQVDRCGS